MKDFITCSTGSSLSISMYVRAPCPPFSEGWSYKGPYRCRHIQWVSLQERNPELRKLESLKVGSKNPPIAPEGDILFLEWAVSMSAICSRGKHYIFKAISKPALCFGGKDCLCLWRDILKQRAVSSSAYTVHRNMRAPWRIASQHIISG